MNRFVPLGAILAMSVLAIIAAPSKEAPQENQQLQLEQTEAPSLCTLAEGLGDISTLVSAGWFMRNNSVPLGGTGWYQGNPATFTSQSGSPNSYIAGDFNNGSGAATISNWLLTPTLQLQNGGVMTFWTRTATPGAQLFPDRLQVRMSTNGTSTDVGTTATSVGGFTTLLLDINPTYADDYPHNWTQYTVTLSGLASPTTGRLAFRYFVENGGSSGMRSNYIGIDTIAYTCPSPTPSPTPTPTPTPTLGNYPDVAIALSTDTTVTPNATPANTARMSVFTSTDFKGRLEAHPGTGVVRITNAHPAGTYSITVRAFSSTEVSAITSFTLTVTTPTTCYPVGFASAQNLFAGDYPSSPAVGDFNGDGKQDCAVVSGNFAKWLTIFLGDGTGDFSDSRVFQLGDWGLSVAVGDFNRDGNQDLAVIYGFSFHSARIFLGDGTGNFSMGPSFPLNSVANTLAVGDFNGDGKEDLVVNGASLNVSVFLGDGVGNFGSAANFNVGAAPWSIAVGDFNRDGKQDLAVANASSNNVSILLGNGTGGFGAATNYGTGSTPRSVVVGDLNGDDKQDLAVANLNSSNVSILLGDGVGHFGAATNYAATGQPNSVAMGDFNGDGKQDLAVTNSGVSILLGDGMGHLASATTFPILVGFVPNSLAVGDFNGNGKQDLVATARSSDSGIMSIFMRNCALTPASIVSRKTHGSAGDFDINLSLTGVPGIECRTTGRTTNDYTLVVTFPGPASVSGNPQTAVTSGTGIIGSNGTGNGGTVTINANAVTVPLTNVTDAQTINVTLYQVNASGNLIIPMGVLGGDVNGDAVVNSADAQVTRNRSGQLTDITNFRSDVNADGAINSGDATIVRSHSGISLP